MMLLLGALTWSAIGYLLGAVAILFAFVAAVFLGTLFSSKQPDRTVARAVGTLDVLAGQTQILPRQSATTNVTPREPPKQKTTREFVAWSLDDQELGYVLQLAKDGYEEQAIEALQLRIARRKKPTDKPAPTEPKA